MATYLITGGAGFIGTNLTIALLAEGHTVKVFDNYAGGKFEDRVQEGAEYIEGDIRDKAALVAALDGVDGIFHMAALPRVGYSVEHPELTHDVNVNGTLNVLQAAKEAGVKRVVFSSSSSTYGDQEVFPLKEDGMEKLPIAPYALHKLIGEHYGRLFAALYGVETISLIYFNVYGPYADPNGAHALVIGRFLKQKSEGEPMTICGDGEYFRDYTYVDDVVRANILAMTTEKAGKGETINIGNNNPRSVNDIVKIIGGESVFVDARAGDGRYFEADITKAKELLGWEPSMELEEGIAKLKAHMGLE
ncbi:MAG: NAD-dependent epimerase/dehydratase family protein [Candidatus Magasanikbacteria bacterium]|jgi:nucleoside-diphosphate-sugar epimerase|nr:NAD-dependent epimerase/dehydratase family protein [Candidatus Magasanikbacteria bacterium]